MSQSIYWLLERDNPPVRFLTLTTLLEKPPDDLEVREARSALMTYAVTQRILDQVDGFADDDSNRAYWKYTGKFWQLIFLGQFLADGSDPRIAGLVKGILEKRNWVAKRGGQCLTANILAALTRLGYGDEPAVREEGENLAGRLIAEGGVDCEVMEYSLLTHCYMAQPKLLLCFSLIPANERSPAVQSAIRMLTSSLVDNEVFVYVPGNRKKWLEALERKPNKEDLPPGATIRAWTAQQKQRILSQIGPGESTPKGGWTKFGFPLHYNSDVLEAMYALCLAGAPYSPKFERSLKLIREKMTGNGRWILENSLNGKMRVDVEVKGQPSKWLTYFAKYVLNRYGGEGEEHQTT